MPGHVPAHRAMQLPAKLSRNSIGRRAIADGLDGPRRPPPSAAPPPPPPFFRFVLSVRRALSFFVVASAVNWLAVRTQLYDCSYSPVGCSTLARAVTSWNHRKHTETVLTSCTNYFLSFFNTAYRLVFKMRSSVLSDCFLVYFILTSFFSFSLHGAVVIALRALLHTPTLYTLRLYFEQVLGK